MFNFEGRFRDDYWSLGIGKLEVLSSDLSTWLVDDAWCSGLHVRQPHCFIGGVLYVQIDDHETMVLEGLEVMSPGIPLHYCTIKLPHDPWRPVNGCFGQSSGFLQ